MKKSLVFVWVHLGPKRIPKYLIKSIARTNRIFPHIEKFIIVDHESNKSTDLSGCANLFYTGSIEDDWSVVIREMKHDLKFREAFWFTTMARFKALEIFMKKNEGNSVIHIESDVILLNSFPVQTFMKLKTGLAFAFESPGQGIAAILYIGSHKDAVDLVDFCELEVKSNPKLTDMTALASYRERFPAKVIVLPTIPMARGADIHEDQRFFAENSRLFSGVFDGISIGQYLFGVDPRNHRGFRKVFWHDPKHLFDPEKWRFRWEQERLFIENGLVESEVFNLHIHSKDLRAFDSKSLNKLVKKRLNQFGNPTKKEFDIRAFAKAIISSLIRRIND